MGETISRNFDAERTPRDGIPDVVFDLFGHTWHVKPIPPGVQIDYAAMMAEPAETRGPYAAKAVRDMLADLVVDEEAALWNSIWKVGVPAETDGQGNETKPASPGLDMPEINKLLAWVMEQFQNLPSTPSAV